MNKEKIRNLIAIILIVIFTFSIVSKSMQNDTFYIIKLGKQICQTGVDWQDHYAIHKNLEYRYPHWAFDVISFWVYNAFGYQGIHVFTQILASVFILLIFWNMRRKDISFNVALFASLLCAYLMKDTFCTRGQIVSYSIFLLEYMILENFVERPTFFKSIALFMLSLIMANMHSTAWIMMLVLVLPFIGEQIFYSFSLKGINERLLKKLNKKYKKAKENGASEEKLVKIENEINHQIEFGQKYAEEEKEKVHKIIVDKRPNIKYIWIAFFVLIVAALCTPLKLTPILYYLKTSAGNSLNYINEHLPVVLASNIEMFSYTVILVAIIGFTNSKFKLYEAFLILGLYIMALSGRRNVYLLIGLTIGIIAKMIDDFIKANTLSKTNKSENKIFALIGIAAVIISTWMFAVKINEPYIDKSSYPVYASEYIKDNLDYKNIRLYNQYEFGSYLLMEDIPVFVDSRCDLYTPEFNKNVVVLDDYIDVQYGKKTISKIMNEYKLEYALVRKKSIEANYMAENDSYTLLYQDNYFILYRYNDKK